MHDKVDDIADVLDRLAKLDFNALDEFSRRDVLDLARTAFSRVMNYAMARFGLKLDCWCTNSAQWFAKLETSGEELLAEMKKLRQFAHCLTELLEASGDFSLNVAMAELRKRHEVNPVFEHTLKGNAENNYCRSFVYELAKECYEPALAEYEKLLIQRVQDDDRRVWNGLTGYLKEKMAVIENAFYEKELSKMAPDITAAGKRIPQTLSLMAELTRQFK